MMSLLSYLSRKHGSPPPPPSPTSPVPEEPQRNGGDLLRSWTRGVWGLPEADRRFLVYSTLGLNIANFEEGYHLGCVGSPPATSMFREASVIHDLLAKLISGNYLGFLAAHTLICITKIRGGWDWYPGTIEEMEQAGNTAADVFLFPAFQLTDYQLAREAVILQGPASGAPGLQIAIFHQRWDVAKSALCQALQILMRNILEGWAGAVDHEQRLYQNLVLCLRVDNTLGALVMHQMILAQHQRGWGWRPSPDEIDAVAESAARFLVEPQYQVAKLVPVVNLP